MNEPVTRPPKWRTLARVVTQRIFGLEEEQRLMVKALFYEEMAS